MAKTVKEKLISALMSAAKLREESYVGDQEGQYSQDSIDAFTTGIEFAKVVVDAEDATEEKQNEALAVISDAVKVFKASVIKPDPPKEPEKVKLKGVVLKGWDEGREGNHSIFLQSGRIVSFKNGKADLPAELADELKKAGYLE